MIELKETCKFMCSDDYKDRFCAEYLQLKERHRRLKAYINRIKAAQLKGLPEPKHECPLSLLIAQLNHMEEYINTLELRAEIEKVDLAFFEELIAHSVEVDKLPSYHSSDTCRSLSSDQSTDTCKCVTSDC